MKALCKLCLASTVAVLAACGPGNQDSDDPADGAGGAPSGAESAAPATNGSAPARAAEAVSLEPGLTMRVLRAGSGETVQSGQTAVVHYTGWLYDPEAPDNRGEKFDSSLDRDQHFGFPVGGGRVIKGWDRGVAGMQVGEVRELTIAPDLAYGDRGAGGVIPPGATLVFEVELVDVTGAETM